MAVGKEGPYTRINRLFCRQLWTGMRNHTDHLFLSEPLHGHEAVLSDWRSMKAKLSSQSFASLVF